MRKNTSNIIMKQLDNRNEKKYLLQIPPHTQAPEYKWSWNESYPWSGIGHSQNSSFCVDD